jgi:hypothetical protein
MHKPNSINNSYKVKAIDKLSFYFLIFGIFFIFFAFGISQCNEWKYSFIGKHGILVRADHPLYFLLGECFSITIGLILCIVSALLIFKYYKNRHLT